MNKYIQVDGHPGLVRDRSSGAIINVNSQEMTNARARKAKWRADQEELVSFRSDVQEMKAMLAKILEDKDGDNKHQSF